MSEGSEVADVAARSCGSCGLLLGCMAHGKLLSTVLADDTVLAGENSCAGVVARSRGSNWVVVRGSGCHKHGAGEGVVGSRKKAQGLREDNLDDSWGRKDSGKTLQVTFCWKAY